MKTCSTCTRWKSASEYYPDRRPGRSRDGLLHSCKACERAGAAKRARDRYQARNTMSQPRDARGQFASAA